MASQATERPLTVTPAKAADMMGIAVGMVRQMLYRGELPAFKIGKRWLIPVNALEAWINNQVKQASGQ